MSYRDDEVEKLKDKISPTSLELLRCVKFFVGQINKGWNYEETHQQCMNSYGYTITLSAEKEILNSLKKQNI